MQKVMSVNQVRKNIYNLIEETAQSHEPIFIKGKNNNAILISEDDWSSIEETLYLNSIPNMVDSLKKSINDPDKEFSEEIEW